MSTRPALGSSSRIASRTAVVLPDPEGPTSAVVVPGATSKLTLLSPTDRASCWKPTLSKAMDAPLPASGGRSRAASASTMSGDTARSSTICSMSMKAWRISR